MTVADSHDRVRRALTSRPAILAWSLVVIWAVLPFLPEQTGLRFSWVYRIFFSAMALIGILFFWFVSKQPMPMPRNPVATLGFLVFATVIAMVAAGVVYPTYPVPSPAVAVSGAVARGKQVFFNPSTPCFRCHIINGKGGRRGPDQSHIASIAGTRVAGLSAEQYLIAKIEAGSSYQYKTPKYNPTMPPFKSLLTTAQLNDLVAYLLTLK
jgi:mono/diheme cytochrome c family protein